MTTSKTLILALAAAITARADFSYTSTRKGAGAASAGDATTKHYLKGQKMMMDSGNLVVIMDFERQTITTLHPSQKTYKVSNFADMGQALDRTGAEMTADVKETGQRKAINGFNATEVVMTIQVEMPQVQKAGMKMQMEMDIWASPDVPGSQELKAFYQKNSGRFPWGAIAQGGNPGMQKAMADLQRKMAALNGVPVLEIVRMKSAGNDAQAAQAQQAVAQQGMAEARAKLEELQKQGGPQAAAAAQALARMGGGSAGAMFEMTMESGNFSTSSIPESVFAIPAGFTKTEK